MVAPDQVFDQLFVYFQHFAGDIRYAQLINSEWSGGENAQAVISSNVKDRTPLAGASTQKGNVWTVRPSLLVPTFSDIASEADS